MQCFDVHSDIDGSALIYVLAPKEYALYLRRFGLAGRLPVKENGLRRYTKSHDCGCRHDCCGHVCQSYYTFVQINRTTILCYVEALYNV